MKKKKVVKKVAKKVAKKTGIGALAKECILKAYDFQKTYATIKKNFPNTEFSKHCYYWYRSHLRTDDGKNVPVAVKS